MFENGQNPIIVGQGAYNDAYGTTFQNNGPDADLGQIFSTSLSFKSLANGSAGDSLTIPLQPKMLQDEMGEAFDHVYGRMAGNMGVEPPNASAGNQNMILYGYMSPPTEILKGVDLPPGDFATPITSADDGTQIWKITHNGVDTHPMHWHLYDVQLINRVGWDGIVRKPDPNELGWKDTIRVSPLEDTIVAMRPILPDLPFDLPNSVRLLDPSMPDGALLTPANVPTFDPNGNPIVIYNHMVNFGWEYMWHCHILSHEEMDMMRAQVVAVAPNAPTDLVATAQRGPRRVVLTWTDNSLNETGFTIQRATDALFTTGLRMLATVGENIVTYTDNNVAARTTYYYRVMAINVVGDTQVYQNGAGFQAMQSVGRQSVTSQSVDTGTNTFESTQVDSEFSNAVEVTTSGAEGGSSGTCFIDTIFLDALNSDAR